MKRKNGNKEAIQEKAKDSLTHTTFDIIIKTNFSVWQKEMKKKSLNFQ